MASGTALNACIRCKTLKKKCDKALPCCARCTRLGVRCQYHGVQNLPTPPEPSDSVGQVYHHSPRSLHSPQISPDLSPMLSVLQSYGNIDYLGKQIAAIIASTGDDIGIFCSTYFNTFHGWFPILAKRELYDRMASLSTSPCPDFAILVLCIHLITKSDQISFNRETREQMYRTAKGLHALIAASGRASKELVQSGALLALYEYSTAMHEAAYLSVSVPARMAIVLGYDKTLYEERPAGATSDLEAEEQRRIWWCIIILERVMRMEHMQHPLPFAALSPTLCSLLPSNHEGRRHVGECLNLSDNHAQDSGPGTLLSVFAQVAQSVYLLDRVIEHVGHIYETLDARLEDSAQLDVGIRTFSLNVLEGPGSDRIGHCWPYTICLSALLLLHRHALIADPVDNKSPGSQVSCRAVLALRAVVRIALDGARSGNFAPGTAVEHVPVWGLHSLSLAARSHIEYGDKSNQKQWAEDIETLRETLKWFKPKWKFTNNYLDSVDKSTRILKDNGVDQFCRLS